MTSRKGVRCVTYVLQLTKIFIVKTSIFTINAINLKITCHGHPTNKAKNLTMTYLYQIQNFFQLFLSRPPPQKKGPLFTSSSVRLTSKC